MAYWIGGVVALLVFCPIAYKLGKKDGAHEAMERVHSAQQTRHKPLDLNNLLGDDLQKRKKLAELAEVEAGVGRK